MAQDTERAPRIETVGTPVDSVSVTVARGAHVAAIASVGDSTVDIPSAPATELIAPIADSATLCQPRNVVGGGIVGATIGATVGFVVAVVPAAFLSIMKDHDAARGVLWLPIAALGAIGASLGGIAGCLSP